MEWLLRTSLLSCVLCMCVLSLPKELFYQYGPDQSDERMYNGDDLSTNEIELQTPIAFYNQLYSSLYVNLNGHISFDTELPAYQAQFVLPMEFKVIAAFLADIDTSASGNVYYRESSDSSLIQRAAADIRTHFMDFTDYTPESLFIATWEDVGYFNAKSDKVNTFQIVLASDGADSFALLHYLDDGIQWLQGEGKSTPIHSDPPAQAGFDSSQGRRHSKLRKSGTKQAGEFATGSNINVPGVWMFQIGDIEDGDVKPADMNTGEVFVFEVDDQEVTCLEGARTCHPSARCVDYNPGFCCECAQPFYGNGKSCLEPGIPQRLSGKVSVNVNGIELSRLDQHSYVVTSDGRSYTAISHISESLGTAMQTLSTIGGIVGWLFAVPTNPTAVNGYMITGGKFNRTVSIRYQSGEVINIRQAFYGHEALNSMRVDTFIEGTLPNIPADTKVSMDDYKEEYNRVSAGKITSNSQRTYRLNDVAYRYTWEQTIDYDECSFDPNRRIQETLRVGVTRNFVLYDPRENIVRYAMISRVNMVRTRDPCKDAATLCGQNSNCILDGTLHRCECKTGFQGDGHDCIDFDECAMIVPCDAHAACYNTIGSFQCRCHPGFVGDGYTCEVESNQCGEFECDENARCVFNNDLRYPICECLPNYVGDGTECSRSVQRCGDVICSHYGRCVYDSVQDIPVCECNAGYLGDGIECQVVSFGCNEVNNCHENAECEQDPEDGRYKCECNDGYSGDGIKCEATFEPGINCQNCDPNAKCEYDVNRFVFHCKCREGFTGDGMSCTGIDECRRCDENAACEYDPRDSQYRCRCRPGYHGDGYHCNVRDCSVSRDCDPNARCVPDQATNSYQCRCNPGFRGDGWRCVAEGCNILDNCDPNGQCVQDSRDLSRYGCVCNPGYEGDGYVCREREVPCNQVNNCDVNAECLYDEDNVVYRCRCRAHFEGDGLTCHRTGPDCSQQPNMCDPNASCLPDSRNYYSCVCNQGFSGDGRSCHEVTSRGNYILYAQGMSIMQIPYERDDRNPGKQLMYLPGQLAVGVSYDCRDRYLYWTDVIGRSVNSARLDGTEASTIISELSSPEGIAIDWIARNMYYTDSGLDRIDVARLDGTSIKTIITDLVNPRAIVVDPGQGIMYWTDWDRPSPKIEQAYMDGSNRKVFVSDELGLPNALTLDVMTQQLCWGDAGTQRLECIRTDGVGRRTIYGLAPYPFAIAYAGTNFFWTDWQMQSLANIDRDGGQPNEAIVLPVGGNGRLYGMVVVEDHCPRVNNACSRANNGGCRFLCLPTPHGGRTCACPNNIEPDRCHEISELRKRKK